jgi:hypothetical protein
LFEYCRFQTDDNGKKKIYQIIIVQTSYKLHNVSSHKFLGKNETVNSVLIHVDQCEYKIQLVFDNVMTKLLNKYTQW